MRAIQTPEPIGRQALPKRKKKPLAQFTRIGFGAKCAIILIPAPLPLITARLIKRDQNGLSKKWMAEHDAAGHKILN
jgi:hypothetical protein